MDRLMTLLVFVISLAVGYGRAALSTVNASSRTGAWSLEEFKALVTFGDGYTDESRLAYFLKNPGQAPPISWTASVSSETAVGGYVWPRWTSWYSGTKLYNYAVAGAVCSTEITPRNGNTAFNPVFHGVREYQVGAYTADKQFSMNTRGFLDVPLNRTVYAIWIGANDIGPGAFLTDSQASKYTTTDYVDCIFSQLDRLYSAGARRIVIMNLIPLNLAPGYALPSNGGLAKDRHWPNKPANLTAINLRMQELVTSVNYAIKYRTAYEAKVARRYNGAEIAMFDLYTLFRDIINFPRDYLNGTALPVLNRTCTACPFDARANSACVKCASPDSYLWYDEVNPSEQVQRVIAREFINVVSGRSIYASYWS